MTEADLLARIRVNPQIYGGKPIIRGMRMAVEHVLGMLDAGDSPDAILEAYPYLEHAGYPSLPCRRAQARRTRMRVTRYFEAMRVRPDRALIQDAWIMKVRYFEQTDTLLIEFKEASVAETRDLDENTVLDVDQNGNICAITIEHASKRAGIPQFSYEQVAA